MMDGTVAVIYALLINKGKIPNTPEAYNVRGKLAITITKDIAEDSVRNLVKSLFFDAGCGFGYNNNRVNLTNYDFCQFNHMYENIKHSPLKKNISVKNVKKTFGKTFWRAK